MFWCILGWHKWGEAYDIDHPYSGNHVLAAIFDYFIPIKCKRKCIRCNITKDDYMTHEQYYKR